MDDELKITKGEWYFAPNEFNQNSDKDGEYSIGSIKSKDDMGGWFICRIDDANEADANAQLIKTSPKLYEVAKIALDLVKTVLYEHPDDEIAQAQKKVIEDALKEARGEDA